MIAKSRRTPRISKSSLDLQACSRSFTRWRPVYNLERPHEALDLAVPASRFRVSERPYPKELPPIELGRADEVRKVDAAGQMYFKGYCCRVGKAFSGYRVAVRPTTTDGLWQVYFCHQKIKTVNLLTMSKPA